MVLNTSGYARKHGVTRERVRQWIFEKRLRAKRSGGVWMINSNEPRPKKRCPWDGKRRG